MSPKVRVVIVDKDASSRALLELLMAQKGYEVIGLAGPSVCPLYDDPALDCPREFACCDFLLIDNHLPGMQGYKFLERQARRGCKAAPCNKAVFSASWTREDLAEAACLGFRTFGKPFNMQEISSWLEEREKAILPGRKLFDFDCKSQGG